MRSEETSEPIHVFQMAKVASMSWMRLLMTVFPDSEVNHFHFVSSEKAAFIRDIKETSGPTQTIKFLPMSRRLGSPPASVAEALETGRLPQTPATIVAGVRDPVARAASLTCFSGSFMGHRERGLSVRDGGKAEDLLWAFHRGVTAAREGRDYYDTFFRLLGRSIGDYRTWFVQELRNNFGIDINTAEFDRRSACLVINEGPVRLFLYRMEDIGDPARKERVLSSAAEFFGKDLPDLPSENQSSKRRSGELDKTFRELICLERPVLDWFYDCDVVRQFYTEGEVAQFRKRWGQTSPVSAGDDGRSLSE